jgi:hypothetical protein
MALQITRRKIDLFLRTTFHPSKAAPGPPSRHVVVSTEVEVPRVRDEGGYDG